MLKKDLETIEQPGEPLRTGQTARQPAKMRGVALCLIGFILCILTSIAPLQRLAGTTLLLQVTVGMGLTFFGSWLPRDLGLVPHDHWTSFLVTSDLEFQALMLAAFVIYGVCALCVLRQPRRLDNRRLLRAIWLGTLIAGGLFVITPAMPSHDIFVYAGYGRVLATHHANPYFVPLSVYPQDPFYRLDDWRTALAAYGPLWLAICALGGLVAGANALGYIFAFRLFAFAAHLLNTFLVTGTLRSMGRSPQAVVLGTLLYGLNPLVLFESGLGGHNDVFMVTFILLGILLSVRGEQRDLTRPRNYLLPLLSFTLAAMIKFTALPVVAFFIILLVYRVLRPQLAGPPLNKREVLARWRPAIFTALTACGISGCIALAAYAPFWLGHNIHDIANSFTAPPSASLTDFSILQGIIGWNLAHPPADHSPAHTVLSALSQRSLWNSLNAAIVAGGIIAGAIALWRKPATPALVLVTLATLGTLLLVTPWFFPWYVIWLVGLAAVCMPDSHDRVGRGLLAFALTFSASAFMVYLFNGRPPLGGWVGIVCLTTVGPPLLALVIAAFWGRPVFQPFARIREKAH